VAPYPSPPPTLFPTVWHRSSLAWSSAFRNHCSGSPPCTLVPTGSAEPMAKIRLSIAFVTPCRKTLFAVDFSTPVICSLFRKGTPRDARVTIVARHRGVSSGPTYSVLISSYPQGRPPRSPPSYWLETLPVRIIVRPIMWSVHWIHWQLWERGVIRTIGSWWAAGGELWQLGGELLQAPDKSLSKAG
jgi:hypothetical protein